RRPRILPRRAGAFPLARHGLMCLAPTPTGCRADSKSFFGTSSCMARRSKNKVSLNKTCFS
ncbi:MAG: hypothetical protein KAH06_07015, partial [Desulfobacterales bacterium]|nr:hypothetical protein [Desulfobacterales bacterium]